MKSKISIFFLLTLLSGFVLVNCTKDEDEGDAPALPPVESLALDLTVFTDNGESGLKKGAAEIESSWNFGIAYLTVAVWNTLLFKTLAIPVVAFEYSFTNMPTRINDNTWEWAYTLGDDYTNYSAKLTAEVRSNDIKWEMRISHTGIASFEDFLWFEGISAKDVSEGTWTLYHSLNFQEEVLTIDWEATGEEINNVVYTYVRELNNDREPEPFNGSELEYGIDEAMDNYYYNIDYYDAFASKFVLVNIEMNRSDYSGRIKSTNWAGGNTDWHCWDADFMDVDCNK